MDFTSLSPQFNINIMLLPPSLPLLPSPILALHISSHAALRLSRYPSPPYIVFISAYTYLPFSKPRIDIHVPSRTPSIYIFPSLFFRLSILSRLFSPSLSLGLYGLSLHIPYIHPHAMHRPLSTATIPQNMHIILYSRFLNSYIDRHLWPPRGI